jgi:hypothetical protein
VNVCNIPDDFNVGAFVAGMRDADIVIAFQRSTPEWWLVKEHKLLKEIVSSGETAMATRMVIIVPNLTWRSC